MCLSLAGLLNIYNWAYFTLSMKTIFESHKITKRRIKKGVDLSFIPSILTIVLLYSFGFVWSCLTKDRQESTHTGNDNKHIIQYFSIMTSLIYFILGILFLISGWFLYKDIALKNEDIGIMMRK